MPKQYTAEIVRSDGDRIRIFSDGYRQRVEFYEPSGLQSIVISRPDLEVAWSLTPGSSVVYETPFKQQDAECTLDPERMLEWQEEGAETIEGIECVRYRGRYTEPAGGAYELCFIERGTGIRRRSITFDKTGKQSLTTEWRPISLGPPDPTAFEVPEGYSVKRL